MMERPSPRLTTTTHTAAGTIIIPRPKSVFSKRDPARQDDTYQSWMQEYHRQHQLNRNQQQLSKGTTTTPPHHQSGVSSSNPVTKTSTYSPSNSLSKKSKGRNLFLNFNSLKTNPYDDDDNNNINTLKKNGIMSPTRVHGKIDQQNESLEGYRIYKGPGNLTLGISRQNTTHSVDDFHNLHKVTDNINGTVLAPYTPLILPDKFILASGKPHVLDNKSASRLLAQQTPKQVTAPFHIQLHPQRRPRPHSASIDFSSSTHNSSSSTKDRNGNKTKDSGKSTKMSYKAPTVTTIQLHSSEAIALTPRSIPSMSATKTNTSTTTDDNNNNIETKPEQQNGQPKSILKNHKDFTTPTPHTIQLGIANYSKTLPLSHQNVKHEFAYHEHILSPNKNQSNSSPTGSLSRHASLNHHQRTSPVSQRMSPISADTVRPKSASATSSNSRYELIDRSPSTRRKSVTFNSYVSFSSDSRVSTIRALPIDV